MWATSFQGGGEIPPSPLNEALISFATSWQERKWLVTSETDCNQLIHSIAQCLFHHYSQHAQTGD